MTKTYFRKNIEAMKGYAPGEQPKEQILIKLNTNENPYPPSPNVEKALKEFSYDKLRLYPDPTGDEVRDIIANLNGYQRENVLIGNGSDDILTITIRAFVGEGEKMACLDPTYSLYPVLGNIQGVECVKVPLQENFDLPENLLEASKGAKLFMLCRPNAPTGNSFSKEAVVDFCREFPGIVLIDEAYADFAEDSCMDLVKEFENVIVSRTSSKSYSLAGARFGYVVGQKTIIAGLMKVKDSYNVNMLTQLVAAEALKDQDYFNEISNIVRTTRDKSAQAFEQLGFKVMPSQTNFLFVVPPKENGEEFFVYLRKNGILVRYFKGPVTGSYVRITVGTPDDMKKLLEVSEGFVK